MLASIRRNKDFQAIYKKGRRHFTPNLGLFVAEGAEGVQRAGFVASAAKAGNAVQRNRAKRRMRALARDILPRKAISGHDYVLIATPTTGNADFALLQKDLLAALQRLKMLAE